MTIVAENKKISFNYQILEKFEAGIVLKGFEVKAVRSGKANIRGGFVVFQKGEPVLININIAPYQKGNVPKNYNPKRPRTLLLKKREIKYLIGKTQEKGLTLLPTKLYIKGGKIKVEIALCKGKKKFDKREKIKKREIEREMKREMKKGKFVEIYRN